MNRQAGARTPEQKKKKNWELIKHFQTERAGEEGTGRAPPFAGWSRGVGQTHCSKADPCCWQVAARPDSHHSDGLLQETEDMAMIGGHFVKNIYFKNTLHRRQSKPQKKAKPWFHRRRRGVTWKWLGPPPAAPSWRTGGEFGDCLSAGDVGSKHLVKDQNALVRPFTTYPGPGVQVQNYCRDLGLKYISWVFHRY